MRLTRGVLAVVVVGGLLVVRPDAAVADPLVAQGSVNQIQVTGATPGATLELRQDGGPVLATGTVDAQGAFVFGIDPGTQDDVDRGSGYSVTEVGGDAVPVTKVTWATEDTPEVLGPEDTPPQSFYDGQVLPVPANSGDVVSTDDDGYGYITMRDGTTLSANILAPFSFFGPQDHYPVVVIYSGYEPSAPNVQGDPDDAIGTILRIAGYAVVSVNIRGTGCSGGAYSYWEPMQGLDGYDVIEAVAAQPWARVAPPIDGFDDGGPMIGMAGISFGGISQLFTARTNPPSLAGITPLSVISDTYRSTLYPGGIANDGFARDWAAGREDQAEPSGSAWSVQRINGGDTTCADNQELKLQAPRGIERFTQDLLYQADPGDSLAPETFVGEIDVPTFIAGAFQDEQTGGHWSTMLDEFDTPTEVAEETDDLKRAVLFNGTHADPLGPDGLRDLLEFLDLYVVRRAPATHHFLRAEAPPSLGDIFGADYALAPPRGAEVPDQDAYEAEDDVVLRWERGARGSDFCFVDTNTALGQETREPCVPDGQGDGAPFGRFESTFAAWPPPNAVRDSWHLGPDGSLSSTPPDITADEPRGWSSFRYETDPGRTQDTIGLSGGVWHKDATYTWTPPPEPDSLRFVTPEMTTTRAYAGSGSARLWLRSTATDVDLEITLSEVRPDGQELYLQSGWLRASNRAEAPGSTALAPRHTHLAHEPLPAGVFTPVRVELLPFAAVIRPGSRLALTVSAPGGNRLLWTFDSPDDDDATVNDIGHAVGRRSRLDLPEVTAGLTTTPAIPASLPVCGDLRSQPCRATPLSTRPTAVMGAIDTGDTAADLDRGIDVTWTAPTASGVTGNEIGLLPTATTFTDDDAAAGFRVAVAAGTPPPTDRYLTVRADIGAPNELVSSASPTIVAPHPFSDVRRGAWNVDAVDWVAAWDLAGGFADGTFRNGGEVTRGQFAAWLWTMFGRPSGSTPHDFADVGGGTLFNDAISWAKAEGIVNGFLGGTVFRPREPINRAQIAQWLRIAAGGSDSAPPNGFVDVPDGAWYEASVNWARDAGVVSGFAGNQYRPTATATRGQAANMFLATATWFNAQPT